MRSKEHEVKIKEQEVKIEEQTRENEAMAWPDIDTKIEHLGNEIKEIKTRHAPGTGGVQEQEVWDLKDEVEEIKGKLRHDTKTRHPKMTLANPRRRPSSNCPKR